MAMPFLCRFTWRTSIDSFRFIVLVLFLAGATFPLQADGTNAAPVPASSAPPVAKGDDFGKYLSDHQAELAPFFKQHTDELVKQGLPLLLAVVGNIVLLNMALGWAIDVGLGFGFSTLFAPAYAKAKNALIYATGRVLLGVVVAIVTGLVVIGLSFINPILLFIGFGAMVLVNFAVQTIFINVIYRSKLPISALFYLCILVVHLIASSLIAGPLIKARVSTMLAQFVDKNLTAAINANTAELRQNQAQAETDAAKIKAAQNDAQNRLDQANAEQKKLSDEIEAKKNSDIFVFSRIARVHAQGDLPAAHDQLTAFLTRFPSGPLTDAAKTELAQVESEMAAQTAQKKQAETDEAKAKAQARAGLLAQAAKGEATLSQMRNALIGKTRDEVRDLFGPPTDTASDRWGYAQHMVTNPLTGEKHGLTVYFQVGVVEGVDYYYGRQP